MAQELAKKLEQNFSDYKPKMNSGSALQEANRCLMCYDAPCTRACPTSIDVPGFIKKIATDNLRGSARVILEANILGASCARICPTEELCEGACVLHDVHEEPIQIGRLQRYATDAVVLENQGKPLFRQGRSNGKRAAMIGAGPASLGCAAELAQLGWEVTCFEKAAQPGGLNSFGIADYKMDYETAIKEIEWLQQLGVEIKCETEVGVHVAVSTLIADYDAVFLGIGLGGVGKIGIPGEDLNGSRDALEFIAELKTCAKEKVSLVGKKVAVLGGGNTAIDAVTQSKRLGSTETYMVYRRDRTKMGAYDHEQELALKDGGVFVLNAQPVEILGKDGNVAALKCVRTQTGSDGKLEYMDGTEFELDVDVVLRATGQSKLRDFLGRFDGLEVSDWGTPVVDENQKTTHEKVWSGGDAVSGGQEVVNAVAEGKRAAQHIHETHFGGSK